MKNLVSDISKQISEGTINLAPPKGTRKPLTAKPAKYKDPVHIPGVGVMEREQAKKHFPDMEYRETTLHKDLSEEYLEEIKGTEFEDVKKLHRHLKKNGWELTRTAGSHDVFTHPTNPEHLSVPRHSKLKAPVVMQIFKKAGIPLREAAEHWNHPALTAKELIRRHGNKKISRNDIDDLWSETGRFDQVPKSLKGVNQPSYSTIEYYVKHYQKNPQYLEESNTGVDSVSMSVPLFIRCLEWAHEEAKDDVEIHKFVENVISKNSQLDTADYKSLLPEGTTFGVGPVLPDPQTLKIHRISVSLKDPTNPMVSKRDELIHKTIRVNHPKNDPKGAELRARAHYSKRGYKVISSEHLGLV